jgi:hypothetical protein
MVVRLIKPIVIVSILLMPGCGSWFGDGRMDSWERVRALEEKTNQAFLQVKHEELKLKKEVQGEQNPTLKMTSYDKQGNVTSVAEMDLQPLIAEITGGQNKNDTYGVDLKKTEMPKGEFAENALAIGDGATKLAGAPAVLTGTALYMTKETVQAMPQGNTFGDNATIDSSFNRAEVHATGEGNTVDYQGTSTPEVVYPEIIEGE